MPLNAVESSLRQMIAARADALWEQLCEHVAIPTGHNHTAGLDRYRNLLRARLEAIGATTRLVVGSPRPGWLETTGKPTPSGSSEADQIPPILIAERHPERSSERPPRILLVGHLDTVHDPHGDFQELTMLPDGVHATGPGVVDMKGGVLVMIAALEALAQAGVEVSWTVLLNSDEETGSFQSAPVLREFAANHDVGIVVEPALADGSLAIERMGSGQFMIEIAGQSAHVGRHFAEGVSAVYALGRVLARLESLAEPDAGRIVNVGPLRGGDATNVVPDAAACWGNVRYRDPDAGRQLADAINALASSGDELPKITVHHDWNRPAKPTTPEVAALAAAARAAAEDLGQTLPFSATGGVCDGNILQDAGLPTIDTMGVRGGHLHRPDEFIEVASLVERSQLMAVLLSRIAAGRT